MPITPWQRARHIRIHASTLVPGPLQIYRYREALRSCSSAREGGHNDADLPNNVKTTVLLEESALHHQVRSPDVMSAQIAHLMALLHPGTDLSLGLLPLNAARTPAELPREPFAILDDHGVILPLTPVPLVLEHHSQTFRYKVAFARLHRLALTGAPARHRLSRLLNTPTPA
ncbi:Scr1 family TA system antitoxin-like transcriptional regulator [Streptomyces sp. NPDC047042]|uniref:Scr1 family TA system antitoxin-like transcriptional regulator n=1 Tax=Streptomyces sp. NPDC047042 TaxID=3154807 RepID=UPI0033C2986D